MRRSMPVLTTSSGVHCVQTWLSFRSLAEAQLPTPGDPGDPAGRLWRRDRDPRRAHDTCPKPNAATPAQSRARMCSGRLARPRTMAPGLRPAAQTGVSAKFQRADVDDFAGCHGHGLPRRSSAAIGYGDGVRSRCRNCVSSNAPSSICQRAEVGAIRPHVQLDGGLRRTIRASGNTPDDGAGEVRTRRPTGRLRCAATGDRRSRHRFG